jgi:acetyl-CoA carboxylase carboxyl transferase subunit beta
MCAGKHADKSQRSEDRRRRFEVGGFLHPKFFLLENTTMVRSILSARQQLWGYMGWFSRKDKPNKDVAVPEDAKDLWAICSACTAHIYREEWVASLQVCPKCGFHERLAAWDRIRMLLDAGTIKELNPEVTTSDPLKFSDAKGSYAEKAQATKTQTSISESVVTARGMLDKIPVVLAVMDFRFLGGSLASGTGEKILLAAECALRHRIPHIVVSASGGARMHEGIVSLMQMAKTCAGVAALHEAGIPYISERRRTQSADRICGPASDRGDNQTEVAGRLPDGGVPSGARVY